MVAVYVGLDELFWQPAFVQISSLCPERGQISWGVRGVEPPKNFWTLPVNSQSIRSLISSQCKDQREGVTCSGFDDVYRLYCCGCGCHVDMPGPLRMGLHDLLISLHLEAHANSRYVSPSTCSLVHFATYRAVRIELFTA